MTRLWERFIERYANDPFAWFQPKGFTIEPSNLPIIRDKLAVLQQFESKHWRKIQRRYTDALRRQGLFTPRAAQRGSTDYAAIVRMNKEVFDSLGLVWVGSDSIIQITRAGHDFLACAQCDLVSFVAGQLRRYMYPNPAVGRTYAGAGVLPYPALLAVLTHFPEGVPLECYDLFISRVHADEDIAWAVEHIQAYLRLREPDQRELVSTPERLPVLRSGRIVAGGRRSSLLNTISLNRPYMLSFLATPGLVRADGHRLSIVAERFREAEHLVQEHMRQDFYIHFRSIEDWIAFYGEPNRLPTAAEALDHYRSTGEVEHALSLFQDARARRGLPQEIRSLPRREFKRLQVLERTIEDFLELNLELLENGLKLVGRQYPTPTGPLDLLARDSRHRWVVIELKRGRGADRTIGQLLRYMAFIIDEQAGGEHNRVRGFAVAEAPDNRLIQAAAAARAQLEVFEFRFEGKADRVFPAKRTDSSRLR